MRYCCVQVVSVGSAAVLLFAVGYVIAQAAAPPPAQGVVERELQSIDLGTHFEAMRGKRMLLAHAVIEPGARGSLHSHRGWPEVVYILKGVLTEHQGGTATDYGPGESFVSNTDPGLPHQIENRGSVAVEAVLVEIPVR